MKKIALITLLFGLFISFKIKDTNHEVADAVSFKFLSSYLEYKCADGSEFRLPYNYIRELTIKEV